MSGKGGWSEVIYGTNEDGQTVTVQFGTGSNAGETRLADGMVDADRFPMSGNHDHYGAGNGPNNNGTSHNAYTGRGSK